MRAEERHYYSTMHMRVVKSWVASTSIGLLRILCQFLTIFVSNIIFMHVIKSGTKKGANKLGRKQHDQFLPALLLVAFVFKYEHSGVVLSLS